MYVYVAGPYTNPDPVLNTRVAINVADELTKLGHTPYVPHLTLFWHFLDPHPIFFWYSYDLEWLKKCDVLLRLPGESKGADKEEEFARAKGIRVVYDIDDIEGE